MAKQERAWLARTEPGLGPQNSGLKCRAHENKTAMTTGGEARPDYGGHGAAECSCGGEGGDGAKNLQRWKNPGVPWAIRDSSASWSFCSVCGERAAEVGSLNRNLPQLCNYPCERGRWLCTQDLSVCSVELSCFASNLWKSGPPNPFQSTRKALPHPH